MSNALFLFTIGPVKSFIQPSRKTRDLYAGSYLLSTLMKEVVDELMHKADPLKGKRIEVILPASTENVNVPNRLVAKISGYNKDEQHHLGKELEQFVQKQFNRICQQIFQRVGVNKCESIQSQLERFLEVYWLFQEYKGEHYDKAYPLMVANMNSIKTMRTFLQSKEIAGRKCDLYPEYNAIFVRKRDGKLPSFCKQKKVLEMDEGKYKYYLKPGESLSAIAFVKRMLDLPNKNNFTSVAYMLLKSRLGDNCTELYRIKDQASETIFDLQNGQTLSEEEYPVDQISVAQKLYDQVKDKIRFSPYYALVKLDGDGIGSLYKEFPNEKDHLMVSKQISAFAEEVQKIIKNNGGICIYAGGEDFLGFLPLDSLFTTMHQLHRTFPEQIKPPEGYPSKLTFSAGIVIAHLMDPLQSILAKVEELESYAKDIDENKNAFAVEMIKRSGESIPYRCKFGEDGKSLQVLSNAIKKLKEQQYSKSFVHHLSFTLKRLEGLANGAKDDMVHTLIYQALQSSNPVLSQEACKEHTAVFYELYTLSRIDRQHGQVDGVAGVKDRQQHVGDKVHFNADYDQQVGNINCRILGNDQNSDDIASFIQVLQLVAFLSREVEKCFMPSMQ